MNSNYAQKIFGLAVSLALAASSMPTAAQTSATPAADRGFCARVETLTTAIGQRLQTRESKVHTNQAQRDKNITDRRTKRSDLLKNHRDTVDTRHAQEYAKLDTHTKTDAQKQALAAFKMLVDKALSDRRAAMDAAIRAFRDGLDWSLASRQLSVTTAVGAFKASVGVALDKAKADCAAKIDPKAVRESMRSSLKAAQDKLVLDRQAIDKLSASIQPLILARKQAFDKAASDFKAATDKARADLKVALATAKTTATTTP